MSNLTDWEKTKNRRTANIGFISRGNAFRDSTPAETARALMIEIESWQATKGNKLKKTEEYSRSIGRPSCSLKEDKFSSILVTDQGKRAVKAYIETPIDTELKEQIKRINKNLRSEILGPWFFIAILISVFIIYFVAKSILFMKGN